MDNKIEKIVEQADDEQDVLKNFIKHKFAVKRAVMWQKQRDIDVGENKALRRKVALLEAANHTMKHKMQIIKQ